MKMNKFKDPTLLLKMASASRKQKPAKGIQRFESEIDKLRCKGNWIKAMEIAKQTLPKSIGGIDELTNLLSAEQRLEEYLRLNPATETNIFKARNEMGPVESQLQGLVTHCKGKRENIYFEASLLLCKLYHAKGEHDKSLKVLDDIGIYTLTLPDASTHFLRLLAEGWAVRGYCLEKIPKSKSLQKYRHKSELDKEIINCYEKSGNLTIFYFQELDKLSDSDLSLGSNGVCGGLQFALGSNLLRDTVQKSSIHHLSSGSLVNGINRFRELLMAVETRSTQSLRQTLARELAEALLRGVCSKSYIPCKGQTAGNGVRQPLISNSKPLVYMPNRVMFVPKDEQEEALLLLLISEAIATHEAVLERSEEHEDTRVHSLQNASAVLDLLTIALVKRSQFDMLAGSFQNSMKYSFDEFHQWFQFALTLISAEKYQRALLVLQECTRLQPDNAIVLLHIVRLLLEFLHQTDEGIVYAQRVLATTAHSEWAYYKSKAHLFLGMAYSMKSSECKLHTERQEYYKKALSEFMAGHEADKNSHLPPFHISLLLATMRQINEALTYVQKALALRSDHLHSLHLLALLLSAQKHYVEALALVKATLEEYPDVISVLFTKSKLEQVVHGDEVAMATCKHILNVWKEHYDVNIDVMDGDEKYSTALTQPDQRSIAQLTSSEYSDLGTGSIRESLAASKIETTLSDVATSLSGSYVARSGSSFSSQLQTNIWLHLAEMYLSMDKPNEALSCIQEASATSPNSYNISYMKGRIHEHKQEYKEAKQMYTNAASIHPSHVNTLQHLGTVHYNLGDFRMAEKILRDAVTADPTAHKAWYDLGKVLDSLGEHDGASDCLMTAVTLESTCPILPFNIIHKSAD